MFLKSLPVWGIFRFFLHPKVRKSVGDVHKNELSGANYENMLSAIPFLMKNITSHFRDLALMFLGFMYTSIYESQAPRVSSDG